MNEEMLNNLPDPLEDPDTGYESAEVVAELTREPLQAQGIIDTLHAASAEQKQMQQMMQSEFPTGPEGDDDFGEVADPDEDSYPDPEDFFGSDGDPD